MRTERVLAALAAACWLACPTPAAADGCRYLDVRVEPRGLAEPSRDLEPLRAMYLDLYANAARGVGLRVVRDAADAWMELSVAASWTSSGQVRVDFYLTPTLALEQHFFVALTADPDFPYSGRSGSVHHEEVPPDLPPDTAFDLARFAIERNWEQEARQVLALCEVADRLAHEGWESIDELRDELVREIERARRERAEQTRSLSIEAEPDAPR